MFTLPRLLLAGILVSWLCHVTWAKNSIRDCNQQTEGLVDCRFQGWQTIPYDVFDFPPGKNAIKLGDNPIICDCRMAWFLREDNFKFRHKQVIQDLSDNLRCASPAKYKGVLLKDLDEYKICPKKEYAIEDACTENPRYNLLNCNSMTQILPFRIFDTRMQKISLRNFAYLCDCSLVWFMRKIKLPKYRIRLYDPSDIGYCFFPTKHAQKRLQDITEEDVCPQLSRTDVVDPCKKSPPPCDLMFSRCIKYKYTFYCKDIDECAENRHDCPTATTICTNRSPNYKCVCKAGLARKSSESPCEDIDECAEGRCGTNAKCTNFYGSYECECKTGFILKGNVCFDIDECLLNDTCSKDAKCANIPGSYQCTCLSGFEGDGKKCKDINECKDGTTCSINAECSNSPGSYLCQCKQGYTGDGKICTDVNECSTNQHNCHREAKCINTVPGFQCHCKLGYKSFKNGRLCEDVDECKGKTHCAKNAVCENSLGSFQCVCKIGYSGNGKHCEDINECKNSKQCSHHAKCRNTDGSYECSCNDGYYGNGKTCKDVDECSMGDKNICSFANSECVNTPGSYRCKCAKGFLRNKKHCSDIDECKNGFSHDCNITELCINYPGGYKCQCNEGYERFSENEPCVKEVQSESNYVIIVVLAIAVIVVVIIACCCYCCCCCCGKRSRRKETTDSSNKKTDEILEPLLYGAEIPFVPMPQVSPNPSMFSTYSETQDYDYYDDIK